MFRKAMKAHSTLIGIVEVDIKTHSYPDTLH